MLVLGTSCNMGERFLSAAQKKTFLIQVKDSFLEFIFGRDNVFVLLFCYWFVLRQTSNANWNQVFKKLEILYFNLNFEILWGCKFVQTSRVSIPGLLPRSSNVACAEVTNRKWYRKWNESRYFFEEHLQVVSKIEFQPQQSPAAHAICVLSFSKAM